MCFLTAFKVGVVILDYNYQLFTCQFNKPLSVKSHSEFFNSKVNKFSLGQSD